MVYHKLMLKYDDDVNETEFRMLKKKKLFKIRTEDNEKQLKRKFEQFFKKVVRASSKLTIKL